MGLFRRRREHCDKNRVLRRLITGFIIGSAIGSVIGKKLLDEQEEEIEGENGSKEED